VRALGFTLTPEHRMVISAVEDLIRKLKPKREIYLKSIFEEQRFPDELWDKMAEIGLFGTLVPEKYGGTGLGLLAITLAIEAFAAEGLGSALVVLTTMDTMAILRAGTEEQKRFWMPKIVEGKVRLAFAITEPDAGSNSFKIRTLARKEGEIYRLTGQKAWITGVDCADYVLVVARSLPYDKLIEQGLPRTYGLSLFLVDTRAKGLSMRPMETMGIEGYRQFFLHFDDVEVPEEFRIGPEHHGAKVMFDALNSERILAAAIGVGISEYALSRAAAYAKERRVFGDTPIGAYQAVQHPLARLRVKQEAARLLTYQAAAAFDQELPALDVGLYANMAKYLASEVAFEAVDWAIQVHGGNGFVKEYHLIQMLAPARLLKTAPINNEMILNFIAEHALGLPRSY